jgi:serine/threonine protein kinase
MTSGISSHRTKKYCAPEVAFNDPRGTRSDIYSLGCVYLEIATVLAGRSIDDLNGFLGGDAIFYESKLEMQSWIKNLMADCVSTHGSQLLASLLDWCSAMTQHDASRRPHAEQLVELMFEVTASRAELLSLLFCIPCLEELDLRLANWAYKTSSKPASSSMALGDSLIDFSETAQLLGRYLDPFSFVGPGARPGGYYKGNASSARTTSTNPLEDEYYDRIGDIHLLRERLFNFEAAHRQQVIMRDGLRKSGHKLNTPDIVFLGNYFQQLKNIIYEYSSADRDVQRLKAVCRDMGLKVEEPILPPF